MPERDDARREALRLIANNHARLMELERVNQERYRNSFLKKRIIQEWKRIRFNLCHTKDDEITAFFKAWEDIGHLLYAAFMEDCDRFSLIALHWWVIGQRETAKSLKRFDEAAIWKDIEEFVAILRKIEFSRARPGNRGGDDS